MTFDKSLAVHALTLSLSDDPEEPIHDFLEMLNNIQGLQPDLRDIPLTIRDADIYMDGSSLTQEGNKHAWTILVTCQGGIWAQAFPRCTSAQRAEIISLIQAFRWTEG